MSKSGQNVVLDGIDLDVKKGEVVVICGRSVVEKYTVWVYRSVETIDQGKFVLLDI